MDITIEFSGVEYNVEVSWEFQGEHREQTWEEPGEEPEFYFEMGTVTYPDGEVVTDKVLLASIEEELIKKSDEIQERAELMLEPDPYCEEREEVW